MATGLAVGKLLLPSSSDSQPGAIWPWGRGKPLPFYPRGGRELMKFTAIHVDRSRNQHAVSEPVSCRSDPPLLNGNNFALAARQSNRRGGWLHKPASGLEGDGLADTFQSCRGTDSHYHSLPHRHKHDTRSPMLGVREAEHRSTRMRYSIPAAGAGRPPCSETSSRPRNCAASLSLGGEKRRGPKVSRVRPQKQQHHGRIGCWL
ncbi:hypothetical protein B0T18DRAFT_196851 [Schizothecium vesticola]|uniref:Uncharacterized protein n=1 Tax=Schizothecium vesticola TaxID=314040 RepID=A0AA40ERC8_9PEZI|nr:hypothetical protein B0T18DRAFT_196851 [Schizothecium vesticola]